jgi:hypothetical protein
LAGTYKSDREPIQAVYTLRQIAGLAQAAGDTMMESTATARCRGMSRREQR